MLLITVLFFSINICENVKAKGIIFTSMHHFLSDARNVLLYKLFNARNELLFKFINARNELLFKLFNAPNELLFKLFNVFILILFIVHVYTIN